MIYFWGECRANTSTLKRSFRLTFVLFFFFVFSLLCYFYFVFSQGQGGGRDQNGNFIGFLSLFIYRIQLKEYFSLWLAHMWLRVLLGSWALGLGGLVRSGPVTQYFLGTDDNIILSAVIPRTIFIGHKLCETNGVSDNSIYYKMIRSM